MCVCVYVNKAPFSAPSSFIVCKMLNTENWIKVWKPLYWLLDCVCCCFMILVLAGTQAELLELES